MELKDIKPNSLEAVICFVLYICAQDKVISESEKSALIKISKYYVFEQIKSNKYVYFKLISI